VTRINTLNQAIKIFFNSFERERQDSKTTKQLSQRDRHKLSHQIQLSYKEFVSQQFDQLFSYSNI